MRLSTEAHIAIRDHAESLLALGPSPSDDLFDDPHWRKKRNIAERLWQELHHLPYNPDTDSELSSWMFDAQDIATTPSAVSLPIKVALWRINGTTKTGAVYPWATDPQLLQLAQPPTPADTRARFLSLVSDAQVQRTDDHIKHATTWLARSGVYTDPPTSGAAAAWAVAHNDPAPEVRYGLARDRHQMLTAWTTIHPDLPCPGGAPVSQPNGTWTDIDINMMLDPNASVRRAMAASVFAVRNNSHVDAVPREAIETGLFEVWDDELCQRWVRACPHWIPPDLLEKTITQHPHAVVRNCAVWNDTMPNDALFAACADQSKSVRRAARLHLKQRGQAERTSEIHPAVAAVLVRDEITTGDQLPVDDEWLAPHIDGPYWSLGLRILAAQITKRPELVAQLANDTHSAVQLALLARPDVPTATLFKWASTARAKTVREAAAKRLATM